MDTPSTGGSRDGGLSTAYLVQPLSRLAAQAFGSCRLSKGLTPATLEARDDESIPTAPPRRLCPVLSLEVPVSHSAVQPGGFLPLQPFSHNFWHRENFADKAVPLIVCLPSH